MVSRVYWVGLGWRSRCSGFRAYTSGPEPEQSWVKRVEARLGPWDD